jgi:hypothetical protein
LAGNIVDEFTTSPILFAASARLCTWSLVFWALPTASEDMVADLVT